MRAKSWSKVIPLIFLLVILITIPLFSACGSEKAPETAATAPEITAVAKVEFDIVKAAVAGYLASTAPNVKAADLNMRIADGDAPYIVSLRSADDYSAGHIPSAVNLKFSELSTLPMDEEILVYCYTGQSASFAAATLGVLDFDVSNLLHGMASWSDNTDVYKKRFNAETSQGNFTTEKTTNAGGSYAMPVLENTASNDDAEIAKAAALTVAPKYISATDLNVKIAEGEELTILSVRKADAYAAGHIPGAINIGMSNLTDNLDKLNPDAPVYVYCYTGHSAAQTAALLQMLGYDAYSVSFGMCGWTGDTSVNMDKCFTPTMSQGLATE